MNCTLILDTAYHFEARCAGCQTCEKSETIIRNTPATSPERAREEKAFAKHLEQRGWSTNPLLCRKCCDDLVLRRVGNAFKDALEVKGGEAR